MSDAPKVSPQQSVVRSPRLARKRKLNDVPFVELFGGRVQGVVSSGSDANRVYVAFFESGTGNFNCSTNNNRPCGGLRGSPCKHLMEMLDEAAVQFGADRVARYLQVTTDVAPDARGYDILRSLRGAPVRAEASMVFSRFLGYLRFVELEASRAPLPEMAWFV